MTSIPTVKIKSDRENGKPFRIINESSFDKEKHELYKEPKAGAKHSENTEDNAGNANTAGNAAGGAGNTPAGTPAKGGKKK